MNLPNIPFELIFIVLFFVLPALSNLLNKRNRQPPPGSGPAGRRSQGRGSDAGRGASGGPARGAARDTAERGRSDGGSLERGDAQRDRERNSPGGLMSPSSADSSGGPSSDPLRRRLEEAQRRVQEALGEEGGRRAQPTLAPSRSQPATPSTRTTPGRPRPGSSPTQQATRPSPRTPARTPSQPVPRPSAQQLTGPTDAYRPSSRDAQGTAPPLRVQRLGGRKRATLSEQERRPLAFDRASIMQGFIWHQVLSPPRAKQPRRTSKSRR